MALFDIKNVEAKQLKKKSFKNEKELQTFIEKNMELLFGVRFLDTEFSTSQQHGGRIDSLGIDENNSPVIIEYKWGEKDNIINQGLFYLDWLMDHVGNFQILVQEKLGKKIKVDFGSPRVILVAQSFNKYDEYAINRMAENIELWTYSLHEEGIFELKLTGSSQVNKMKGKRLTKVNYDNFNLQYHTNKTNKELKEIFDELREKILELSDVEEKSEQKSGVTYRTTKSFTKFEFHKNFIGLLLRESKYKDPKKLVKDITTYKIGYKGYIKISKNSNSDYLFDLIKQSYFQTN